MKSIILVFSLIVIVWAAILIAVVLGRRNKKLKPKKEPKSTKKLMVYEDISRDYLNFKSIKDNVIESKAGKFSIVLRYSTLDPNTLDDEEMTVLETSVFEFAKKFKGEAKFIITEDRQDLKELASKVEARQYKEGVSEKLKAFIGLYVKRLREINTSTDESQISKYISLSADDMPELKQYVQNIKSSFDKAGIDLHMLSRQKTIETLMKMINHQTREEVNIDLDALDQIAPECIDDNDDYLYLGKDKYCRIYGIIGLTPRTSLGIYDYLFKTLKNKIDITFWVKKMPHNYSIKKMKREKAKAASNYEINRDQKYAQKANLLEELIAQLEVGDNTMHNLKGYIKIWGSTKKELEQNSKIFESEISDTGTIVRPYIMEQTRAFASALPIGGTFTVRDEESGNYIDKTRFLELLATGNNGIQHKDGNYWGPEKYTGSPIVYNPFIGAPILTNPMMAVFGKSGAGKTEVIYGLLERDAAMGLHQIIFDLEDEAEHRITDLGGNYISVRPGEKIGLNMMDVEVEENNKGERFIDLYSKKIEVQQFLNVLMVKYSKERRELDGLELTIISEAVDNLYIMERGITKQPETLYEEKEKVDGDSVVIGRRKKKMPILSDLKKELEKYPLTADIAQIMSIVTGAGTLSMFDCETSIDITRNKLIAFGFKEIKDPFGIELATIQLLTHVWAKYSDFSMKKIFKSIKIDEGWFIFVKESMTKLLDNLERRGRKYKIGILLGTQQVNDCIPDEHFEGNSVLLENSSTVLLLKQNAKTAKKIVKYFDLPEHYVTEIPRFAIGEGLLLSEEKIIHVLFERIGNFDLDSPDEEIGDFDLNPSNEESGVVGW